MKCWRCGLGGSARCGCGKPWSGGGGRGVARGGGAPGLAGACGGLGGAPKRGGALSRLAIVFQTRGGEKRSGGLVLGCGGPAGGWVAVPFPRTRARRPRGGVDSQGRPAE